MSSQAIMVKLTWMADAMGNRVRYAKHCGRVRRFILSNETERRSCSWTGVYNFQIKDLALKDKFTQKMKDPQNISAEVDGDLIHAACPAWFKLSVTHDKTSCCKFGLSKP